MAMFLLGFRKIDGDRWEFANEEFLRGKRTLLKNINRRKSPRTHPKESCSGSSMAMELLGAEDELEKLRSEKHMLMQEVVKIKQEHLVTIKEMDELNCRLQSAELSQKQILSFWAKVLTNPVFLMQLKRTKKLRKFASTKSIKSSFEPSSTPVLQGSESNKPLEIFEPSFSPNASFKGKNILVTKEDAASVGSSDFYISSPEEFSPSKMLLEPISPFSEGSTQQDFQIDAFNSESVVEIQDCMAVNDVVSQEDVFLYSVKPGAEIACKEEFWDVEFEAAGSFTCDHDVWDNIFCTNSVVSGDEIGLSDMWDFGLHSDELFDVEKCFGSEVPLLPDMDEDGPRGDHLQPSEP